MKNYLFTIVTFIFAYNLNASHATINDQLLQLNTNWSDHTLNYKTSNQHGVCKTEKELIQLHLALVEKALRENCSSNLRHEQKKNRLHLLNVLHEYWSTGLFPKNTSHQVRTPYFIDIYGTACAVGQLIISTGNVAIANQISLENNNGYISDLVTKYPEITDWAQHNGFTVEELMWIQPCYAPPLDTLGQRNPTCHSARNGYFCPDFNQLQGPLTKYFYRWADTAWVTYMDFCGGWMFNRLNAGKYKWQVTDGLNTVHTFSIELVAPAAATVSTIKSGDFNSCNGVITVSVQGGVPPFKYYWAGHTGTISILNNVCEEAVNLTVYEAGFSCPQFIQTLTSPVGLQKNSQNLVNISPNPVKDVIHITFEKSLISTNIKLFDIYGRIVLQLEVRDKLTDVDLSQLHTGLYFLQADNSKMQRILKE